MKSIAFSWGIAGVLLLLLFAVYRLAPMALELTERALTAGQWLALGFSIIYMISEQLFLSSFDILYIHKAFHRQS